MLKQRKAIRYEVVGALKNPFDTAAHKVTVVSTKPTAESADTETKNKENTDSVSSDEDIPSTSREEEVQSFMSDARDPELEISIEKRGWNKIENEPDQTIQEAKKQKIDKDSISDVLVETNTPDFPEDDISSAASTSSHSSLNFQFNDPIQPMLSLVSHLQFTFINLCL